MITQPVNTYAFDGTGTGTPDDPYLISTCDELQSFYTDDTSGKTYELTNDIDCSDTATWNDDGEGNYQGFSPINDFNGVFDGNDHTVSGLYINRQGSYVGLFSQTGANSIVMNLRIDSTSSMTGLSVVGSVAGAANGALIDVHSEATVTGDIDVGGIVGVLRNSPISPVAATSFTGTVTAQQGVAGGIAGRTSDSGAVIIDSFSAATITGHEFAGGIIGRSEYAGRCDPIISLVQRTYSNSTISIVDNPEVPGYIGGIVGAVGFELTTTDDYCIEIRDSFSTSTLDHNNAGGVIGLRDNSVSDVLVANNHYTVDSGDSTTCVGHALNGATTTIETCNAIDTSLPGNADLFEGNSAVTPMNTWDFTDMWEVSPGNLPQLRNQDDITTIGTVSNITSSTDSNGVVSISWDLAEHGLLPIYSYSVDIKLSSSTWQNSFDSLQTPDGSTNSVQFASMLGSTAYDIMITPYNSLGEGVPVTSTLITGSRPTVDITTCQQLMNIDLDTYGYSKNYRLTKDIDCAAIPNFDPIGPDWDYSFRGNFDGQNHSIKNLNISKEDDSYIGVFTYVEYSTIKDLYLEDGLVTAAQGVGALAGGSYNSSIINVHSSVDVVSLTGVNAGGLVGELSADYRDVTVTKSSSTGNVTGFGIVGGLIGSLYMYERTLNITESFTTGDIKATSPYDAGGLIGRIDAYNSIAETHVNISDSYSSGSVEGSPAGGLIGTTNLEVSPDEDIQAIRLQIENSYATGELKSSLATGGLIGYTFDGADPSSEFVTITNSFSSATHVATGSGDKGGIVGSHESTLPTITLTNVFYDQSAAGTNKCMFSSVLTGCTPVNSNGSDADYFKGNSANPPLDTWDFTDTWKVVPDEMPKLAFFQQPDSGGGETNDDDNDGVSNEVENAGPNNGDANNDGTSDSTQAHVNSFVNSVTNTYAVLAAPSACSIQSSTVGSESANAVQDSGHAYPAGLMDFTISCGTPGYSANITQYYYGVATGNYSLRKYVQAANAYFTLPQAVIQTVSIGGQSAYRVSYTIVDGSSLDDDGSANGTIVDPVGLSLSNVGVPNTGLGGSR